MQDDASNDCHGHRKRLRERFLKTGLRSFAEHEVLELILMLCIPRRDVKPLAKALLKKFGSVRSVLEADGQQLRAVGGLGEASVVNFALIRACAEYYLQQTTTLHPIFSNNEALVKFWQSRLGHLTYEVFEVAYLNEAYRLMNDGIERMEEGVGEQMRLYPQKILKSALIRSAHAIVIAHNHPSEQATPSQADLRLTQNLQYATTLVGIRFLDHIIITRADFYSFRQSGFLA